MDSCTSDEIKVLGDRRDHALKMVLFFLNTKFCSKPALNVSIVSLPSEEIRLTGSL